MILPTLLKIASDRQIGSRAIQTFQNVLCGRVVEAGLYKLFIPNALALSPNHKRFARKISKLEGLQCAF